jgi:hypothetical protein
LPVPGVGFKNADFWRPHRLAEGLRRAGGGVQEGRWALIGVLAGGRDPWLAPVGESVEKGAAGDASGAANRRRVWLRKLETKILCVEF